MVVGDAQRRRCRRDAASSQRRVGREHDLGQVPVAVALPPCSRVVVVTEQNVPIIARVFGLAAVQRPGPVVSEGLVVLDGRFHEVDGVG